MASSPVKQKYIVPVLMVALIVFSALGCTVSRFNRTTESSPIPVITPTSTALPLASPSVTVTAAPVRDNTVVLSIPDFSSVISRVKPSVVAITTEVTTTGFFGNYYTQQGAGSGWVITTDGLIVTNNHVVEGASSITVTLADGRSFSADSVHTDAVSDLAIIKIGASDLPALTLGDSTNLQVGQWVVAIGNSLGMGISATKGIVSALGVSLSTNPGESLDNLIQTDAAINPGNSGGPLVNLQGELVGINSVKVAEVGVEGMGYSISIEEAKPVIDQLIANGYVVRPYLGANLYTVDQYVIMQYRLSVNKGVFITGVASGSPAAIAGIEPGDVITNIDGKEMNRAEEMNRIIRSYQVGQQIQVTVYRRSAKHDVNITLTQAPVT